MTIIIILREYFRIMKSFPVGIAKYLEKRRWWHKNHSANAQLPAKIPFKSPPVLAGFAGLIYSRLFNGDHNA
jgi:hypothetical protein